MTTCGTTADGEAPDSETPEHARRATGAAWRVTYVWTRAVGTGGLLLAAIAMYVGPNMWNLGRIIAAGMALICLPVPLSVARGAVSRSRRSHPVAWPAGVVVLSAFLALAAVWFAVGLLGWLGLGDPVPIQSLLRLPAILLAICVVGATLIPYGELRQVAPGRRPFVVLDALAQAGVGAGGIMIVAAPFELVGVDVRAYLVAAFVVASLVHLLVVLEGLRGSSAVADAGLRRDDERARVNGQGRVGGLNRTAVVGTGLVLVAAALAVWVPGWVGPIAGGLLGQFGLCLSCAAR